MRTAASECAPQPYSTLTTRPSAGESPLLHTPNAARSDPATGTQNAQVPVCGGAASHRAPWADVSLPPSLGRLGPTVARQHPLAPETEFKGDLRSLLRIGRIIRREERDYYAWVIRISR